MAITKVESGTIICEIGQPLTQLHVIARGIVKAAFPGGRIILGKGDVVGIQDIKSGILSCTYTAVDDVCILSYPFTSTEQIFSLLQKKPDILYLFFTAQTRFNQALLVRFAALEQARTFADEQIFSDIIVISDEEPLTDPEDIIIPKEVEQAAPDTEETLIEQAEPDTEGTLIEQAEPDRLEPPAEAIMIDVGQESDTDTQQEALCEEKETAEEEEEIFSLPSVYQEGVVPEELKDSLTTILTFGECEPVLADRFKEEIKKFTAIADKDGSDDATRMLRNAIAKDYYTIYGDVFIASIQNEELPPPVKLFLLFGYVDETLAGTDNLPCLMELSHTYKSDPQKGIYTFYDWMLAIYHGDKDPSRNEFDTDYTDYLHEQKASGKITAKEEKHLLKSKIDRVRFELDNLFPLANKMTFGRISTFCPVFSEHNVLKKLPDILVTKKKLMDSLNAIRSIDFSAFYRETVYTNTACGIPRDYVQVEVLPDIILMPNVGTRCSMWQEIEGKRRTTPSRMLLPVFSLETLHTLMIRMTAEFRWEMCKRIQGAYWNNLSERSLTSEYFDYIQFYKRNRDLSTDAKEKIKGALKKAKNSIKEMFISDYLVWINFEGNGSPRMNRIARAILFTYCPFPAEKRNALNAHPLYKDVIDRYHILNNQKIHHYEMICAKIEKAGFEIPQEIKDQIDFLKT